MFSIPIIPSVSRVRITGFSPLFSRPIDVQIMNNRLLILGGNGLGKTTILQSIVYCVAGEADSAIEEEKANRWNRKYFSGRIADFMSAVVEVHLLFDEGKVTLARGFRTSRLQSISIGDDNFVYGPNDAEMQFEKFLQDKAGYRSLDDFRFLFHKLCYLPENRSNLAWNSESQVRLLMMLFGDIIDEAHFRERRKLMKEYDSRRRHINVHLNDARKRLDESELLSFEVPESTQLTGYSASTENQDPEKLMNSLTTLVSIRQSRITKEHELAHVRNDLSELIGKIEEISEELVRQEESFVQDQINRLETDEARLAIHKLLHLHLCPACGTQAEDLATKAESYAKEARCPLCGTEQALPNPQELPLLDAELSEKIRARTGLELKVIQREDEIEELRIQENALQLIQDEVVAAEIDRTIRDLDAAKRAFGSENPANSFGSIESTEDLVTRLSNEYLQANGRFEQLRHELAIEYDSFERVSADRISLLAELYEEYATAFLGIPCVLEPHVAKIKFLNINRYVPKFGNQIRDEPEDCSEAQRFFLDIAFRMALIDLCHKLRGTYGTFICETPENALDITYVENVADMFRNFSVNGHVFIATSNLQPGALAGPILNDFTYEQKLQSILNLLEIGVLSSVQNANKKMLTDELHYILGDR